MRHLLGLLPSLYHPYFMPKWSFRLASQVSYVSEMQVSFEKNVWHCIIIPYESIKIQFHTQYLTSFAVIKINGHSNCWPSHYRKPWKEKSLKESVKVLLKGVEQIYTFFLFLLRLGSNFSHFYRPQNHDCLTREYTPFSLFLDTKDTMNYCIIMETIRYEWRYNIIMIELYVYEKSCHLI